MSRSPRLRWLTRGLGSIAALLLIPAAHAATNLNVGCSWFSTPFTTDTYNVGYMDTHASYYVAALPTTPTSDTEIIVEGRFPAVRYFSFQLTLSRTYSNLLDQIPDAELYSEEGGAPNPNPAVVPESHGNTDHYRIVIKFQPKPAVRENNTLYAGLPTGNGIPQIVFRRYLADAGHTVLDTADLPALTYVGPLGTIPLTQTPDAKTCIGLDKVLVQSSGNAVNPARPSPWVHFSPVWYVANVPYPNADSDYLQSLPSTKYGEMVVIRAKPPITPVPPPATVVPEVRYWSICQNVLRDTSTVACLADPDILSGSDGYATFVVSATRPAQATAELGYNWLPWGTAANGYIPLRETLPSPDFGGSYAKATSQYWLPLSTTLGDYAPQITYCDSATFAANAAAGGAALFKACQTAHQQQIIDKFKSRF